MYKKIWKFYKFPILLFISILIGSILGFILKDKAKILEPIGKIYINLLFTLVIPLVFTTISSSIANMKNIKRLGKILKYMIIVFFITSVIASLFILFFVLIFKPSSNVIINNNFTNESINIGEKIVAMFTVGDFYELLSKNNMLPLIIFTCLFGLSMKLIGDEAKPLINILEISSKTLLKMIEIINKYAPIGLCAYFASLTGTYGKEFIGEYAKSFVLYLVVAILYYIIFYTLYVYVAYKKEGVKLYYKNILLSTITSLSTCSSLATLPINIKTCDNMKLSNDVSKVVLPIGSTIHMEGSSMASILKITFLFSLFGYTFNISNILVALLISILSSVVMSGIPGGGMIGEMLIVSLYGFPKVAFPIISTIGWLIDSPGTCLNAVGDIPSAMLINKLVNNET